MNFLDLAKRRYATKKYDNEKKYQQHKLRN